MASLLESTVAKLHLMRRNVDTTFSALDIKDRLSELEEAIVQGNLQPSVYKEYGILQNRKLKYEKLIEETEFALEYLKDADTRQNGTLEDALKFAEGVLRQMNDFILLHKFTGPYDSNDALLTIQPGEGGRTDISEKLIEAYKKFAQSKGFVVQEIDRENGGATLKIEGQNAYAFFRGEDGVHKFILFAEDKKQTKYINVIVEPELEQAPFELNDCDIIEEYIAASTKGGQNANRSHTGVRLTHKPTSVQATARSRSQRENLKAARQVLYSRVIQHLEGKPVGIGREVASRGGYSRRYDLTTARHISDTRTNYFTRDVESFFKGQIDELVYAFHGINMLR